MTDNQRPHGERATFPTTKVTPPRLAAALVVRERLLRTLADTFNHRVTLVSASAGWGKTTLLGAWARSLSFPIAWVSLDELDNAAARFWAVVIAALQSIVPDAGSLALAVLRSPERPPLSTTLTLLLNELARREDASPLVLILDDYHLITDEAIHESVSFFVEHLPAHIHLLLASRVDPPLPLARWRVRDHLLELRTADLRFTGDETTRFFAARLEGGLADEDARILEQRTEGWIAGLHLAALGLHGRTDRSAFVQAFARGHRYLLDYVQDEILHHLPTQMQRFLLQIAALRRMHASLCDAVTGETNSHSQLEWLVRQNLFVVALDEGQEWYRIHDLFREVLLARLQATEPELLSQLQARAARWHAMHHDMREAIEYAMAAQDFTFAADCIEHGAAEMWRRGEAKLVLTWMSTMPDEVLQQRARLALDAALRLLEAQQFAVVDVYRSVQQAVERMVKRVQALLHTMPQREATLLQHRMLLLEALMTSRSYLTSGNAEGMRQLAEETETLNTADEIHWQLIPLALAFWYTESLQREGALLTPRLLEAKLHAIASGDQTAILRVMRLLALTYMRAGRLRLLEQETCEGLAFIEAAGELSAMTGYFSSYLIEAYYASNRLSEAAQAAREVLRIAQLWHHADLLYVANDAIAWVALASRDIVTAKVALAELEELARQERFAIHAGVMSATRTRYWLATGNLAAARNWAAQQVFSPETWHANRQFELLQVIRVLLADRQHAQALELLQAFSAHFDRPGDIYSTILFLALHGVALQATGQNEHAQAVVMRLLDLTAPEDNIRVFLDEGAPMRNVLQELYDAEPNNWDKLAPTSRAFVAKLLYAFDAEAQRDTPPTQHTALHHANALAEPLTRREQDVLRLLIAGASNNEIAERLVISLATVKKHVGNILGKLGVATRAQAVARAHDLPHLF